LGKCQGTFLIYPAIEEHASASAAPRAFPFSGWQRPRCHKSPGQRGFPLARPGWTLGSRTSILPAFLECGDKSPLWDWGTCHPISHLDPGPLTRPMPGIIATLPSPNSNAPPAGHRFTPTWKVDRQPGVRLSAIASAAKAEVCDTPGLPIQTLPQSRPTAYSQKMNGPSDRTIKRIFALSRNRCAYPDCIRPLYPKINIVPTKTKRPQQMQ